jgi:arylsulfatase A-like enzyme
MLAEQLRDVGYATGGFVANEPYTGRQTGLARGFARYEDFQPLSPGSILRSCGIGRLVAKSLRYLLPAELYFRYMTNEKSAREVVDAFLAWQESLEDRPFFAFLNMIDAHSPYDPIPPFDTRFSATPVGRVDIGIGTEQVDAAELDRAERAYDGEIAFLDVEVGRLLDALRVHGLSADTVVIITSDHGEHFGEHGLTGHSQSLYAQLLHIPLVVIAPERVPAGLRVNDAVSLRDLAATILDLSGSTRESPLPGTSLRQFWDGSPAGPSSPVLSHVEKLGHLPASFPAARGPLHSVVEGKYHYIRNGDRTEELYDLDADPEETANRVSTPEGRLLSPGLSSIALSVSRESEGASAVEVRQ